MCDFLSCAYRADGAEAHVFSNSHSEAVASAQWRENEPHKRPAFIEAEWDGRGTYPGAEKICRIPDGEELTAKQRAAVDRRYKSLAAALAGDDAKARKAFPSPAWDDVKLEYLRERSPVQLYYLVKELRGRVEDSPVVSVFADKVAAKADLGLVWPRFAVWLLEDETHGVIRFANAIGKKAIHDVVALHKRTIAGDRPSKEDWDAVGAAARAAAYFAMAAKLVTLLEDSCSV